MTKTTDHILTEACIELALLLTEQTSELLTTDNQALRYRLKTAIADTHDTYHKILQGLRT